MRLRWVRGRDSIMTTAGTRAREWLGLDDAGNPIARVIHLAGPMETERGMLRAVALDREQKLIQLLPLPPADGDWLAVIGGRVVGRAAAPLAAVRRAEAAL
ncbi:MAG: hypothetical protein PHT60_07825 [Acidiphilium sp.]|nr:hypothetical protein [Acidiphilium sp.]MDD4935670.1 hypothetical protein [Acidiphilium sp.]